MTRKDEKFKQIHKDSKDKIYRLCLSFVGNKADADDLFQEIYIKVWKNLDGFKNESNINTWIYRIATNTALLQLNKKSKSNKRVSQIAPENLNKAIEESEASLYGEVEINKLQQVIFSLKKIDRVIIHLVLEDNSYGDIAEITGLNVSNVGVRINRIKKTLAKKMK
ncbi:MAG: RNA polymerase sigma factor [Crocinitomicaceae bacterium]